LLVVATVVAGRGCGHLAALLVPLFVALDAVPNILDDDSRRHFPAAAWGRVKLGHLVADGILCVDVVQLLGGVLNGGDRCLERSYHRHVVHIASRHISPWPLGPQLCFHQLVGSPWCRFRAHRSGCAPT
jgi:hypothetical protein